MSKYKFGISSFILASPFTDGDVDQFDRAKGMGFDLIEVCIEDPSRLTPDALIAASERTGLPVSICGAFGPDRDVSHDDPAMRELGIEYLKLCVDYAQLVGSPHVAGPMYSATGKTRLLTPDERKQQRTWAAESLRGVADYAGEHGVSLAIEPLNRFETDLVNTVEQGLELIDLIGRDNAGFMLDTFHMNIEEKSAGDAIRSAGAKVFHFQVSENDRGTPGTGNVAWQEVWMALDDIGYEGTIVIESFLPTVKEIARAVSLWRPVAPSMDALSAQGSAVDLVGSLTLPQVLLTRWGARTRRGWMFLEFGQERDFPRAIRDTTGCKRLSTHLRQDAPSLAIRPRAASAQRARSIDVRGCGRSRTERRAFERHRPSRGLCHSRLDPLPIGIP
jgi:D-psicose/D-tagatose/L-ribulose 3-epimerase